LNLSSFSFISSLALILSAFSNLSTMVSTSTLLTKPDDDTAAVEADFLGGGLAKTPSTRAALILLLLRCSSLDSSPLGPDVLEVDRLNGLLDRRLLDPDLLDDFLDDDLLPDLLGEPLSDDCLDNDLLVEPLGKDLEKTRRRLGGDLPGNDLLNEPLGHCLPGNDLLGEFTGLDLLDKLSPWRLLDEPLGTASLDDLTPGELLEDESLNALLDDLHRLPPEALPGDHPGMMP
jgi:hypothetical protein